MQCHVEACDKSGIYHTEEQALCFFWLEKALLHKYLHSIEGIQRYLVSRHGTLGRIEALTTWM